MSVNNKLLIYGMNYAPEVAGTGRYTGDIGQYLSSNDWKVTVVTTHQHYPGWKLESGVKGGWKFEKIGKVGIFRCPIYLHSKMSGLKRLAAPISFALSSAPVAMRQILKVKPSVILVVEPTLFVAPVALIFSRFIGAKTILHVQDLEIDAGYAMGHLKNFNWLFAAVKFLEAIILKRFDVVITIAEAMAQRINEKGVSENKIHVIRNWVDLDQIRPECSDPAYRQMLGLQTDDFVAMYSGNIGAKQGLKLLVDAARRLENVAKIKFVIAGRGPMKEAIARAALELPNIIVLDFQPNQKYSAFLAVADVQILPQEQGVADLLLPSKLGGMLASGRPIIVTTDEGTELANFLDGSCILTPPGNPEVLANTIEQLYRGSICDVRRDKRLNLAQLLSKGDALAKFSQLIKV